MNNSTKNQKTFNPFSKFFPASFNLNSSSENTTPNPEDENNEGHLIVDMFEKDNSYYIIAPAAGVAVDDIEIELNDDYLLIKGRRQRDVDDDKKNFLLQECYWGSFSRKIDFPTQVDSEKAAATFKDGMLTICVPKTKSAQTKTLKIKTL